MSICSLPQPYQTSLGCLQLLAATIAHHHKSVWFWHSHVLVQLCHNRQTSKLHHLVECASVVGHYCMVVCRCLHSKILQLWHGLWQCCMTWVWILQPEVAHVGLYKEDLVAKGIRFDTYTRHLKDVDRAMLDGETEGAYTQPHMLSSS